MKTDAVYLAHIIECIRRIEETTAQGRDVFLASPHPSRCRLTKSANDDRGNTALV